MQTSVSVKSRSGGLPLRGNPPCQAVVSLGRTTTPMFLGRTGHDTREAWWMWWVWWATGDD